jgi:ketosteroid isomerase-like protein
VANATTTNTASFFRFRGNKIAELVEYCDTDLIERVLGPYEEALKHIEG